MAQKTLLFRDLNADDPDPEATTIESVCVQCFKNGSTRLLLTKIPFYKEVVIMSFACEHCGFENNEIQSASQIQPKGCRMTLNVTNTKDLNRRIIKSDFSCIRIPDVDLEIPSNSQKGEITTLEGIIERTITALQQEQDKRRQEHPEIAKQIDDFIVKLNNLKLVEKPFTLHLEDISGNCHIENFNAPKIDPNLKVTNFIRSKEENEMLGFYNQDVVNDGGGDKSKQQDGLLQPIDEGAWPLEELHGEVLQFPTNCHSCGSPCQTNMKLTNIPHFKEVVIMATVCDVCGLKTNEVKSGGGVEEKGVKFLVKIKSKDDLSRDVLKSETCHLCIPELDCEVGAAALVGRFTTIEGILTAMKEQLEENALFLDSQDEQTKSRFKTFIEEMQKIISANREATLILDDPAGNSYIQSLRDDGEPDELLEVIKYERTFDQNEELGLNDMKTENY